MAEIKFEVIEHIGIISEASKGWTKELNLISWNGNEPKYDLRDWSPNKEKMGKGITLSKTEVDALKLLLKNR
ncbi:YdbC family protein [Gottfriedia acidiceleris]|uniref:YdbC family protein n=1 Tax=Gottfriedia acidiceleris TaxID=371036 RepID=UPI0030005038